MYLAHLHLLLNHLPIIGMPISLLVFLWGILSHKDEVRRVALGLFILISVGTAAAFFTGEPAEHFLEEKATINESTIGHHEESAEVAIGLTAGVGLLAFAIFYFEFIKKTRKFSSLLNPLLIFLTIACCLSLGYSGYLGGKIRHTEFSSDTTETRQELSR